MNQLGFFDFDTRLTRIDKEGDPLVKLNDTVDWEIFRPILEEARTKPRKSNAGAKGFDVVLLFKILPITAARMSGRIRHIVLKLP